MSFDFRQAKKDGENETMKHERVGGDQEGPGEEGEETRKCVYFRGKKKKNLGYPQTSACVSLARPSLGGWAF